jgi:hypothetical protein
MAMANHPPFGLMIAISPFAREPEPDEDHLGHEDTHETFEHDDGTELHMPRLTKAEVDRRIRCLEIERQYWLAIRDGNERAANRAREQLHNAMSEGESDE